MLSVLAVQFPTFINAGLELFTCRDRAITSHHRVTRCRVDHQERLSSRQPPNHPQSEAVSYKSTSFEHLLIITIYAIRRDYINSPWRITSQSTRMSGWIHTRKMERTTKYAYVSPEQLHGHEADLRVFEANANHGTAGRDHGNEATRTRDGSRGRKATRDASLPRPDQQRPTREQGGCRLEKHIRW